MYITKKKALKLGMSYEGTYFGVPTWLEIDDEGLSFIIHPKFKPLKIWCNFIEKHIPSFIGLKNCKLIKVQENKND